MAEAPRGTGDRKRGWPVRADVRSRSAYPREGPAVSRVHSLARRLRSLETLQGDIALAHLSDQDLEDALRETIDRIEAGGCSVPVHWRSMTLGNLRRSIHDMEEQIRCAA